MTTIIKITKDANNFYQLWLSSGTKLAVSEDTLVQQRLLKGMELSDEQIAAIKKTSSYDIGLQLALHYLSYQLRSIHEMDVYLKDKDIFKQDRKKIIERLLEMNLLDDQTFSESYVRTAMRTTDKGPKMIAQFLKKKGVSETDIQSGLRHYLEEEQVPVAVKTADAAMKRYHKKSFKDALQKVKVHLMQKGFAGSVIEQALEQLAFEKDDDQELVAIEKQGEILWRKYRTLENAKRKNKIMQNLYQKGFDYDLIRQYLEEKEQLDEEE